MAEPRKPKEKLCAECGLPLSRFNSRQNLTKIVHGEVLQFCYPTCWASFKAREFGIESCPHCGGSLE